MIRTNIKLVKEIEPDSIYTLHPFLRKKLAVIEAGKTQHFAMTIYIPLDLKTVTNIQTPYTRFVRRCLGRDDKYLLYFFGRARNKQ